MPVRKRKTKDPCQKCFLHKDLCICLQIPKLDLSTRLILVVHFQELKRTTTTGRLALEALVNSQMFVRGQGTEPLDLSPILRDEFETLLFYPSEDAVELSDFMLTKPSKPIQLIVPDGNWRQASKVSSRHPELKNIRRVKIGKANTSDLHLRKEHFPEGMSTLEAIAQAFSLIEGELVGAKLQALYQAKLEATLKGRAGRVLHKISGVQLS